MKARAIASTPPPPYYAVIFTNLRADDDPAYDETARRMEELAAAQDGFLGMEHARDGLGITVSYWRDLEAVAGWKRHAEHLVAQRMGREQWYSAYRVRVALVERDHGKF